MNADLPRGKYRIAVIGTSLGGLTALEILLGELPADFPLPIVVVQHRDVRSVTLAQILQRGSRLRVREPGDKEAIRPGVVYLAPPDYHLLLEPDGFALSTDGPVCYARPSIDVLFESAADAFGKGAIGVILTGASSDGASGAAAIDRRGGTLIVQDPHTAESSAMPRAAIAAVPSSRVLPLRAIPAALVELCVPGGATSAA